MRDTAYSESVLKNGENSDTIELSDDHVVVLRVLENISAKLKPLDSVESYIRIILQNRNRVDMIASAANAAKLKISDGAAIDEVIAKDMSVVKTGSVKKQDIDKVDPKILEAGFKMLLSDDGKKSVEVVSGLSNGMALVVLEKIDRADVQDKTLLESNGKLISNVYSNADFNAAMASIVSNADIYRNTKVLEQ